MTRSALILFSAALLAGGVSAAAAEGHGLAAKSSAPKLTVLYFGDSIARESQPFLTAEIERSGRARVVATTFPGTAPCDHYRAMSSAAARHPNSPVVMSYYGNVITPCAKSAIRSWAQRAPDDSWAGMYREQLQRAVGFFPTAPRIWLALSPTAKTSGSADRNGLIRRRTMLAIASAIAAANPRVSITDAGASVNAPDGTFALNLPCLADEPCTNDGQPGYTQVRATDGLHLCPGVHTNAFLRCSRYESGAIRYGHALAAPLIAAFGL